MFPMPFGYLKDPLFLACLAGYWLHRFAADYGYSTVLLRSYLNDVICIPFWVPMILWAQRVLRLRPHDDPPHGYEVVIPLVLWSLVFEVILPNTSLWAGRTIPDPFDVLCYAAGAFAAMLFWGRWYRARESSAA